MNTSKLPRPPHRPGIPALERDTPAVPSPQTVAELVPGRYVGSERAGEQVAVFTIHDGGKLPAGLVDRQGNDVSGHPEVLRSYRLERDWGSDLVAKHLARHLGLGGFFKVDLARVALDLGRLPGDTPREVPHLQRRAVFGPVGRLIPATAKQKLLQSYDRLDADLIRRMSNRVVNISIHTYDPKQADGTLRPELSLITGLAKRRHRSMIPAANCSPLFPMKLREAACHPALIYHSVLNLERLGREVALNRPYELHEGSVEFRAQAKFFFRFLLMRFSEAFPSTSHRIAYQRVWEMLLDVSGRSADARALRLYLMGLQPAPAELEWLFSDACRAYREIDLFLARHGNELLADYRFQRERPSSMAVEVRKDLLCEIDRQGRVAGLRVDADQTAREIARELSRSVASYVRRVLPAAGTRTVGNLETVRVARVG